MNGQEMDSWIAYGGGLQLWQELYAPFNLIPLRGGNTGVQMGGSIKRMILLARLRPRHREIFWRNHKTGV
jgi:TRAP-type mannitol/chloroaromatic compound transport system substrate-binding protein